jgi:hypothetical protein
MALPSSCGVAVRRLVAHRSGGRLNYIFRSVSDITVLRDAKALLADVREPTQATGRRSPARS